MAPPPLVAFAGRVQAMAQILEAVGQGRRVFITGQGGGVGFGRTALALEFAHGMRSNFPDGVFWVVGSPFDPYLAALRIATALKVDLRMLAPSGEAGRAFEALLAGRRCLLVLDEVSDTRLLHMLPPIGPSVVFTGRDASLADATDAAVVTLGPLTQAESEPLLHHLLGTERLRLEPVAARELTSFLGHHPLSIRIAVASLTESPPASGPALSLLVRNLRSRLNRLQSFSGESRLTAAAFSCTLETLSQAERGFLHAISVLSPQGFSIDAAATVGQAPAIRVAEWLGRLVRLCLVQSLGHHRFALHPLVGDLARGLGPLEDPRSRAGAYFLGHALSHSDAPELIDQEIEGILAAMSHGMEIGDAQLVKDFALALGPYFDLRGFREEVPRRLQWGVAAARATHDVKAEGRLNRWLGRLFVRRGALEAARERLEAATSLAVETGDSVGKMAALLDLARLEIEIGRFEPALEALEQALPLTGGRRSEEGTILLELGIALSKLGRMKEASERLEACQAWAIKRRDRRLEQASGELLERIRPSQPMVTPGEDLSSVMQSLSEVIRSAPPAAPALHDLFSDTPGEAPSRLPSALQQLVASSPELARALLTRRAGEGAPVDQVDALEALAAVQKKQGDLEASEESLIAGAEVAEKADQRARAAGLFEQAGRMRAERGDLPAAIGHFERSIRLWEQTDDQATAAASLCRLGRVLTELGHYDAAMYSLLRAIDRQETLGDDVGRAESLFRLGVLYAARGAYPDALAHYDLSEALWLEARNLHGLTALLQARGRIFGQQGDLRAARECLERSFELADGLEDDRLKASALHQLGLMAADSGDYSTSMDFYRRSLTLKRSAGDLRGMAVTLHAMAQLEVAQGRGPEARRYYARVLEIATGLGAVRVAAATLRGLGDVETADGQLEAALQAYLEAERLQAALGEKRELAAIQLGLGTVYAERGEHQTALQRLRRALEIVRELQDLRQIAAVQYQLGAVLAEAGQDEEASACLQESLTIDDGLGNIRGTALTLAMLGQLLDARGRLPQSRAMFQEALRRMEALNMPEAETVRSWLAG